MEIEKKKRIVRSCFVCGPSSSWKASLLRSRKKTLLCPDHLKEYDAHHITWPRCPACRGDSLYFIWGGTSETTIAACDRCAYAVEALTLFDKLTVNTIARPIERK